MSIHIRVYPQYSNPQVKRRRAQQVRRQREHAQEVALLRARRVQQQQLQAMYGIGLGWGNTNPLTAGSQVLGMQAPWGAAASYGNFGGFGGNNTFNSPPPSPFASAGFSAYAGAQASNVPVRPEFIPGQSRDPGRYGQFGGYDQSRFGPSAFAPQARQGWGARFGSFFGF